LVTPLVNVGSTANSQVSEDELPGGHRSCTKFAAFPLRRLDAN